MSAQPLVITHAGGARQFVSYSVADYRVEFARRPERLPGETRLVRVWGDAGALPAELTVVVFVRDRASEGSPYTLEEAYALAYDVIDEAETATVIKTHMGDHRVTGLMGYRMMPDGDAVLLTLRFAPSFERAYFSMMVASESASAERVTDAVEGQVTFDSGGVTFDSDEVTFT